MNWPEWPIHLLVGQRLGCSTTSDTAGRRNRALHFCKSFQSQDEELKRRDRPKSKNQALPIALPNSLTAELGGGPSPRRPGSDTASGPSSLATSCEVSREPKGDARSETRGDLDKKPTATKAEVTSRAHVPATKQLRNEGPLRAKRLGSKQTLHSSDRSPGPIKKPRGEALHKSDNTDRKHVDQTCSHPTTSPRAASCSRALRLTDPAPRHALLQFSPGLPRR